MKKRPAKPEAVIKLRCSAGHLVTCSPGGVQVTHANGILIGHETWCEQCLAYDSAVADPQRIAMLLEAGAELAPYSCDVAVPLVSDNRRLVSAKYLPLDALTQLADAASQQDVLEQP